MTHDSAQPSDKQEPTTIHVHRVVRGEGDAEKSLEWIVGRFTPLLVEQARYRLRGRISETVDPEDVAMDVWFRTLPQLNHLVPRNGRLTPVLVRFLATTLKNRVEELLNRHLRGKPARSPALPSDIPQASADVIRAVAASDSVRQLINAATDLEEIDRDVIVLHGVEQKSYRAIASLLGCKEDAVRQRYSRAIKRLREAVPESVYEELGS